MPERTHESSPDTWLAPTTAMPSHSRAPRRVRPEAVQVVRAVAAVLVAVTAITFIVFERVTRQVEAVIATFLVGHTFADRAIVSHAGADPTYTFGIGKNWWAGVITQECSIGFYLGAILGLSAVALLFRRLRPVRVLTSAIASCMLLIVLNQIRLVGLGWVFATMGRGAFEWAHSLGGSVLMLAGLGASLLLFFLLAIRSAKHTGRRRHTSDDGVESHVP